MLTTSPLRHAALAATLGLAFAGSAAQAADRTLLNASYDVSRELFADLNPQFVEQWQNDHDETVEIQMSHAGSSTQARAILQGLDADVVTFNQVTDVNVLAEQGGLIPEDWQSRLPNQSSPWYSTMAFLVREGNPHNIQSWSDLVGSDVSLIFPNPKTSGNGRYTYLAAWAATQQNNDGDEQATRDYMRQLLRNVEVFDTGGRGATNTFVERGIGDVLITFESEANGIVQQYGEDDYDVIVPPVDIMAEFPVTWVDENLDSDADRALAKAYLEFLYSEPAQRTLAENYYRVNDENVSEEFADRFPQTDMLRVNDVFGSWDNVMQTHFASGGTLDQLQRR
ncbi:thiosulfate ABC transporter substrate-binding protein CysP [Kushneria aurantia]|uniref:Thiosulfate ABC transporter substrate-binding protein CysP n=1 Tax=Kushneria aurantia TaxID=504092 RepID=A0ABV6G468_9GAMM|nr:thiosulfate ABC transporter substrate-binding protein CysP [Kushneria aurantia]